MTLFEWNERFSLGLPAIDRQHSKLVDIINELHAAMRAGLGPESLTGVVEDMMTYAYSHFSTEEYYMERAGYPELAAHKREHEAFIEKVNELQDRLRGSGHVLSLEVLLFLKDWLLHHIQEADRRYLPYLREKGLG